MEITLLTLLISVADASVTTPTLIKYALREIVGGKEASHSHCTTELDKGGSVPK